MPDDNRFAGLSDAVDDPEEDESDESNADLESANDEPTVSDTDTDPIEAESVADESESDDPTAFPFDATEKKTVYVRPETLDDLEDARALADAQLRTDHDVRDLTGREFYDAAFRLAAADTDGLIEEILEAREE